MKVGFLTGYSEEIVRFAGADSSFDCLEISGPPSEWIGDSGEATIARQNALSLIHQNSLTVASFLINWPSIRTGQADLPNALAQLSQVFDVCKEMDDAVATGAGPMGYNPEINLEENIALYKAVYSHVAGLAEDKGVKIGFENWPGGGGPFSDGGNLAVTPEAWGLMFEAVPSPVMGLEFDPSHLIWQGIDAHLALDEFSDRVHIVHAKDTEVFDDRVQRSGVFRRGGWWRYRLPGFADFDWQRFFAMCHERKIDCPVVIEHEDAVFSGDRRPEGFTRCGVFLRSCLLQN
ncbi:MAG: sugar phosphate isomerase/epimerase [Candidatus Poribacteria bacterium]|jgi:sugar phosphate isomerase/epimerase|nr:sugar phosphate isomerase/epimerase [Candidatus Poribacteria bacterium]